MTVPDPADLAPAATGADEFEAQTKAAVLEAEGIDAFVFTAERNWTGGVGLAKSEAGVAVWVKREDIARAKQILRERAEDARSIDWEQVDVGERVDSLPLRSGAHVPWLPKIGFYLAVGIVILSAVVAILVMLA